MKLVIAALLVGLFVAAAESKTVRVANIDSKGGKKHTAVLSREYHPEETVPEKEDIFEINKDQWLIDGDIIPPKDRNTIKTRLWDTTTIPVSYANGLSVEAIASIDYARVEYELRTCLRLTDRSNERNYITFDTLSGCYSSVGQVGGGQTISIGNGCERIGTVVHEIMHAIGIYHEQSRTDRDDYVQIQLENVDSGKEHNFNTYSYNTVDERRVAYDYNSVMHYSDTSFSNNGEPTIVTNDPTYQDVIGQRRAFSIGDTTKINRMYKCADTVRYSYSCDFEDMTVCGYVQETTDTADWSQYQSSIAQPIGYPATDSTFNEAGGSYMLFDTTQAQVTGAFDSMRMKSTTSSQCLEFSYHMKIASGSSTALNVYVATVDETTGDVIQRGSPVTTISQDQLYDWNIERLTISANSNYKLIFEVAKDVVSDVVAVDDVSVVDKPCETGYFVIRKFSELIATSQKGDYMYSPLMYTDDGYAFQIKVYPLGTSSSSYTNYMSLYYAVAMGENDEKLQWPFSNRFIRLSVVDQDPDTVTRMSQSNNLVSDTGSNWQKPISSRNGAYGYSSFMPISDITSTRSFLKHDSVVISIEVRDMSSVALSNSAIANVFAEQPPATQTEVTDIVEDFGYSPVSAVSIVAISAASTFLFMIIVMFVMNEKNSKRLNKIMLNSTK